MQLPAIFTKKEGPQDSGGVRYIRLGSPMYPDNPLDAVPSKPFGFQMVDVDGRVINEAWLTDKWSRHPNAGPYVADALDDMIFNAAAMQAASLKSQMEDEGGHAWLIAENKSHESGEFDKLRNHLETLLVELEEVLDRLLSLNA